MGRFSIRKLFQELLVIVCLVIAGWVGYQLFVVRSLDPVTGSIIFIVDIVVLIWNIAVLRSHYYRRMHPSFRMVFFPLLAVVLILAFAGVQPLARSKDLVIAQTVLTFGGFKDLVINQMDSVIDSSKSGTSMDGEVKIVSFGQEAEYEIIGFERLYWTSTGEPETLPSDSDWWPKEWYAENIIELSIKFKPTDRTVIGALYNIEVIGGGTVLNYQQYKAMMGFPTQDSPETSIVNIEGAIVGEMLAVAEQRHEDAKSEAEDIIEELDYNYLMRGQSPTYDEYKRIEKQLEKLRNEMKKWEAISNGQSYGGDLHTFLKEYFSVSFIKIE